MHTYSMLVTFKHKQDGTREHIVVLSVYVDSGESRSAAFDYLTNRADHYLKNGLSPAWFQSSGYLVDDTRHFFTTSLSLNP